MKALFISAAVAATLLTSIGSYAQAPASAPTGSTGLCKDGTYYSGASKRGACSDHKGLKDWYGPALAAPATAMAPTTSATPATANKSTTATTPSGGAGMVWVNTDTKVYHCPNTRYYGKTKTGSYMSEVDAKAKGYHASHGKACS